MLCAGRARTRGAARDRAREAGDAHTRGARAATSDRSRAETAVASAAAPARRSRRCSATAAASSGAHSGASVRATWLAPVNLSRRIAIASAPPNRHGVTIRSSGSGSRRHRAHGATAVGSAQRGHAGRARRARAAQASHSGAVGGTPQAAHCGRNSQSDQHATLIGRRRRRLRARVRAIRRDRPLLRLRAGFIDADVARRDPRLARDAAPAVGDALLDEAPAARPASSSAACSARCTGSATGSSRASATTSRRSGPQTSRSPPSRSRRCSRGSSRRSSGACARGFPPNVVPRRWHLNTCLVNFYGDRDRGRQGDRCRARRRASRLRARSGRVAVARRARAVSVRPPRRAAMRHRCARSGSRTTRCRSSAVRAGRTTCSTACSASTTSTKLDLPPKIDGFRTRRVNFTFRYVPDEHVTPFAQLPAAARDDVRDYVAELAQHSPFFAKALASASSRTAAAAVAAAGGGDAEQRGDRRRDLQQRAGALLCGARPGAFTRIGTRRLSSNGASWRGAGVVLGDRASRAVGHDVELAAVVRHDAEADRAIDALLGGAARREPIGAARERDARHGARSPSPRRRARSSSAASGSARNFGVR